MELLNGVFHFQLAFYDYYTRNPDAKGELRENELFFHIPPNKYVNPDCDEDTDDHDLDEEPCLNRIFGMDSPCKDEQWKFEDSRTFYEWLQPIMCPSVIIPASIAPYIIEDPKCYPVAVFMLTHLAPGWVGGVLVSSESGQYHYY